MVFHYVGEITVINLKGRAAGVRGSQHSHDSHYDRGVFLILSLGLLEWTEGPAFEVDVWGLILWLLRDVMVAWAASQGNLHVSARS